MPPYSKCGWFITYKPTISEIERSVLRPSRLSVCNIGLNKCKYIALTLIKMIASNVNGYARKNVEFHLLGNVIAIDRAPNLMPHIRP